MKQSKNTVRVVCKIIYSGQIKVYDIEYNNTINEMFSSLDPFIKRDFGVEQYKIIHNNNVIERSNNLITSIFAKDYINIHIKPDYMYSVPECIFYNNRNKLSARMRFLIRIDAIKKIQKFFRDINKRECPCCFEKHYIKTNYYTCNHLICDNCFKSWNQRSSTCPYCREKVQTRYRRGIFNTIFEEIINNTPEIVQSPTSIELDMENVNMMAPNNNNYTYNTYAYNLSNRLNIIQS
jgi:hypothetical protein